MALKYRQEAKILFGVGDFPYDMLRYDRCFPAMSESARDIGAQPLGDVRRAAHRNAKVI
jgi:hypothetical protein